MEWALEWQREPGIGPEETARRELYALGVIYAYNAATGRGPVPNLDGSDLNTQMGYSDAVGLMNKVLRYGDAPEGDYADLIAMPYDQPF
jgi:hypothetical protein